jgi:flagellar hook-length control protein FliK
VATDAGGVTESGTEPDDPVVGGRVSTMQARAEADGAQSFAPDAGPAPGTTAGASSGQPAATGAGGGTATHGEPDVRDGSAAPAGDATDVETGQTDTNVVTGTATTKAPGGTAPDAAVDGADAPAQPPADHDVSAPRGHGGRSGETAQAAPAPEAEAATGNTAATPPAGLPNGGVPGAPVNAPAPGDPAPGVQNQALAGVAAPAPATATAPADAPAPPAPPAAPAPPSTQIAMRIAPLRLDADGVHRLTVNLHPADLGPVQVVAEIRGGEINVQLSGATDAGNDALRNAIDDLRRELQDAGFANCSLDLRQGNAQQDQARQQFSFMSSARGGAPAVPAAPDPVPTRTTDTGRLDVEA